MRANSADEDPLRPRAMSAASLARDNTLTVIKRGALGQARSITSSDLRPLAAAARVVTFQRASALADLGYFALPGLTSRVATHSRLPAPSPGAAIPVPGSYLRLELLDRTASLAEPLLPAADEEDGAEYVALRGGLTPALLKSVSVALLSALQYGYNGANMNTQAGVQRVALGIPVGGGALADNVWSLCVSLFCIGALAGCNLSGALADTWGRKKYLLVSAAIFAVGGLLEAACALPPAPVGGGPARARIALLVVGRLVSGVACGGTTVVVPMYLGEVAPAHLRGLLGSAFQLTTVVGMFAAQLLGLPGCWGTAARWPAVLGAVAGVAAAQLLLGGLLIESPRWHCLNGSVDDAHRTLCRLRRAAATDDAVLEELEVMLQSADVAKQSKGERGRARYGRLLRAPTRYPLGIAVCLMVLKQFSGINIAFNFSSVFLRANGMDEGSVQLVAILMNSANVAVTLVSAALMDRAGRRPLLLLSTHMMLLGSGLLTLALSSPGETYTTALSVGAVVVFVAAFGIGLGPIAWLLPAEIMPSETRALAYSVAASTNWLAYFVASQVFLTIADALGSFAFVPFAACLAVGGVFVMLVVPETKGKSLEQIQTELAFGSRGPCC